MKLFILQPVHEDGIRWLRQRAEVITFDDPDVKNWKKEADGIIVRGMHITREDINEAEKLKVISKHGVGTDAIDLAAAEEKGIIVTNTPTETVQSVAEQAVALMLAVSRRVCTAHDNLKAGRVPTDTAPMSSAYMGCELFGKTAGIIGTGRIAISTGEILRKGFHMNILVYAPSIRPKRWAAADYSVEIYENLKQMVSKCDFISCHLPLKKENYNLINREILDACKPNAIIINTGRGGVIDENALFDALKNKKIQGAGLDVFEREPVNKSHPLFSIESFVASPHNGTNTVEALRHASLSACQNAYRVLTGEPVDAVVR